MLWLVKAWAGLHGRMQTQSRRHKLYKHAVPSSSFRFASEKIEICSGMNSATKIVTKIAKITKNTKFWEAIDKTFDRKLQIRGRICCIYFLFYFLFLIISFAKKQTNKQTNKQKERWQGHRPQQLWPITAGPDTNKKRQEVLKNTAIQEKPQLHTTIYWTRQGTSIITF